MWQAAKRTAELAEALMRDGFAPHPNHAVLPPEYERKTYVASVVMTSMLVVANRGPGFLGWV